MTLFKRVGNSNSVIAYLISAVIGLGKSALM